MGWNLENTYHQLPDFFYSDVRPSNPLAPKTVQFNLKLAETLGLSISESALENHRKVLSGLELPPGSTPLAQAYAGHQFGHFTMLGDGRAVLLGEQITPSGNRFDIHLKGAGQTRYSRNGDGRAALGPMLREYLISEAMNALGISTTRSLAVTLTGDPVQRENILPGAVLARIAESHIRVGTFEYAAAMGNIQRVKCLADYTLNRHFQAARQSQTPYLNLLREVLDRQARLISKWTLVGFVHGVMNTDNMSICGETIDYGPCAFLDEYDPSTTFSSIDRQGRYAFGNQMRIGAWNLARFAETLLPLIELESKNHLEVVREEIAGFTNRSQEYWLQGMRSKLGLLESDPSDLDLVQCLLAIMHKNQADYTNTFLNLNPLKPAQHDLSTDPDFIIWAERYAFRLTTEDHSSKNSILLMQENNPVFIPRNHKVDQALNAAVEDGNFEPFNKLLSLVNNPFVDQPECHEFKSLPKSAERILHTFCGT